MLTSDSSFKIPTMTLRKSQKVPKRGSKQKDTVNGGEGGTIDKQGMESMRMGGNISKNRKQEVVGGEQQQGGSSREVAETGGKLERRASLRRKFGALIRGGADLPAAINRGLQPIRRSLSFSKDLNRLHEPAKPYRTSSVQWYNSLGSLAEDEHVDEVDYDETNTASEAEVDEEEVYPSRNHVTRTRSLIEKNIVTSPRRRANTLSAQAAPYARHSDHYDSSIDLSNPPCEASSLPALTHAAIGENDNEAPFFYRLTHGFDNENANNSPIAESYICQQKISDGIELHKRAIRFATYINTCFRWSYFFTLSLSLVCISVSLFCLTLVADRSRREFGLFLITSGAVIAYIFVYMYPGQGLIDCSNAVIQKTYSALWYSKPVKVQKLILLVMQRSMIPSVLLIGNVAPVSLESFTWIFQTSISYFTALCSLK